MTSYNRRESILEVLRNSDQAVSATTLANLYEVSRQIIVGDIALLRASGNDILATPRGYVYKTESDPSSNGIIKTIACKHTDYDSTADEIYTIIENGAQLLDVIVEHPLYGQISGQLSISSKYDADEFLEKFSMSNVVPLSELTEGIHLHTIECESLDQFERIKKILLDKGILLDN